MAAIEEAFVARLKATAGVTALVGSGGAARIYGPKLEQGVTYPAIGQRKVGQVPDNDLDSTVGVSRDRIELSCYGRSVADAVGLAREVRLALHGFAGTIAGVVVKSVLFAGDGPTLYEDAVTENDVGVYRIPSEFTAWYELATS